jgi:hypothetical protein
MTEPRQTIYSYSLLSIKNIEFFEILEYDQNRCDEECAPHVQPKQQKNKLPYTNIQ